MCDNDKNDSPHLVRVIEREYDFIHHKIGEGAHSCVYRVKYAQLDPRRNTIYAIKMSNFAPTYTEWPQEKHILSRILDREPFYPETFEHYRCPPRHTAIVFEYCKKGALDSYITRKLARGVRVLDAFVWHVFLNLGSAVAGAHAKGVVHRDIKPENILLKYDGNGKKEQGRFAHMKLAVRSDPG